ncbi:MAG: DUF1214 domain-containing protein [Myxococcota bacterium]|jgi:hypothetical protein|nr:DUF1214 domain-containing protein [Myxococcota bacterium]
MSKDSEARILDGTSWAEFCDTLKRAGEVVLRDTSPMDAFERAEGFRYLSRLTRVALESYIEFADPEFPVLRRPAHETVKIGADNPDNYYQSAAISGAHEYVIRGTRNTVHYLGMGTYVGNYGSGGRMGQSGYVEGVDLAYDENGRFEILLSCNEPASGNWLPMEPDTSSLIVRQTFQDRATEKIADLTVERVGGEGALPITAAHVDEGLAAAAAYVRGTANLFTDWTESFAKHPNELRLLDPNIASAAHGDPNICYYHGYWELDEGEALVIETTPPECDYWNFQLNNYWMESLDYRYHAIDVNHHGARREDDGRVVIVVAPDDPGRGNWIDTAGHLRGTMCLRWIRADHHPKPECRVVKASTL